MRVEPSAPILMKFGRDFLFFLVAEFGMAMLQPSFERLLDIGRHVKVLLKTYW